MRRGYLATWVGALAGVLTLGALSGAAVYVLGYRRCDPNGFDCLGAAISVVLIGMVGAALGAVLGCYAALRLRRDEGAGRTAWVLLGLLVISVALAALVGNSLDGAEDVWAVLVSFELLAVPVLARRIALMGVRKPRSEPPVEI